MISKTLFAAITIGLAAILSLSAFAYAYAASEDGGGGGKDKTKVTPQNVRRTGQVFVGDFPKQKSSNDGASDNNNDNRGGSIHHKIKTIKGLFRGNDNNVDTVKRHLTTSR